MDVVVGREKGIPLKPLKINPLVGFIKILLFYQ